MKKSVFTFLGIAMLAVSLHNLKISTTADNRSFNFISNIALADDNGDESGTGTYASKTELLQDSYVTTTKADGSTCTTVYAVRIVECTGTGKRDCSPSTSSVQVSTTC